MFPGERLGRPAYGAAEDEVPAARSYANCHDPIGFLPDTRDWSSDRGLRRPAIRKSRLREPADIPISAAKVARDDRTLRPEQPSLPTLIRQAVIAMTAMTAMIGGA